MTATRRQRLVPQLQAGPRSTVRSMYRFSFKSSKGFPRPRTPCPPALLPGGRYLYRGVTRFTNLQLQRGR